MRNSFDTFKDLPEALQLEAIREGERLLDAQLTVATAADQRALTWAGFLVAAATGALGGGIALFSGQSPDPFLGYLAIFFGIAVLRAAWLAISTVQPDLFGFPGNRPEFWLPEHWDCNGREAVKIEKARADQARHIETLICENRDCAATRARGMTRSFRWTVRSVIIAGLILLGTVTHRNFPVWEITTQFIQKQSAVQD